MEQEKSKPIPENFHSFYRTELTVLRSTCQDDQEFIAAVAALLTSKDAKIEELETELSNKIYLLNKLDIDHE